MRDYVELRESVRMCAFIVRTVAGYIVVQYSNTDVSCLTSRVRVDVFYRLRVLCTIYKPYII